MKAIIRKYLIRARESDYSSRDMLRAESMVARHLMSLIRAWSELAKDSRNKNDWNNFAKYTLKEIEELGEMIKEEK